MQINALPHTRILKIKCVKWLTSLQVGWVNRKTDAIRLSCRDDNIMAR